MPRWKEKNENYSQVNHKISPKKKRESLPGNNCQGATSAPVVVRGLKDDKNHPLAQSS